MVVVPFDGSLTSCTALQIKQCVFVIVSNGSFEPGARILGERERVNEQPMNGVDALTFTQQSLLHTDKMMCEMTPPPIKCLSC